MTENKILLEAINQETLQDVLKQIRELAESPSLENANDPQLDILLIRARAFTGATDEEILATVKAATGDELDIILGNFSGEIPTIRKS